MRLIKEVVRTGNPAHAVNACKAIDKQGLELKEKTT
jgi:hypothetical protein